MERIITDKQLEELNAALAKADAAGPKVNGSRPFDHEPDALRLMADALALRDAIEKALPTLDESVARMLYTEYETLYRKLYAAAADASKARYEALAAEVGEQE